MESPDPSEGKKINKGNINTTNEATKESSEDEEEEYLNEDQKRWVETAKKTAISWG